MMNERRAVRKAGGGPCRVLQQRRQLVQGCGRQHAGAARTGPHHRGQVCRVRYGEAGWTSAPVRREHRVGEMSRKACGLTEITWVVDKGKRDERRLRQQHPVTTR